MSTKISQLQLGHRAMPKRYLYPSDHGLALTVSALIRDYGRYGAINRLIEAAEMVERDEDMIAAAMRCRRVDPHG